MGMASPSAHNPSELQDKRFKQKQDREHASDEHVNAYGDDASQSTSRADPGLVSDMMAAYESHHQESVATRQGDTTLAQAIRSLSLGVGAELEAGGPSELQLLEVGVTLGGWYG